MVVGLAFIQGNRTLLIIQQENNSIDQSCILLQTLNSCLFRTICIWQFIEIYFSNISPSVDYQEMAWKSQTRRGKCFKILCFRIVALTRSIYGIKIQFSNKNSLFTSWYFNLRLLFLFSRHFLQVFAQKSIILGVQNISMAADSVFMPWTPNPRLWIWLPTVLSPIFK